MIEFETQPAKYLYKVLDLLMKWKNTIMLSQQLWGFSTTVGNNVKKKNNNVG